MRHPVPRPYASEVLRSLTDEPREEGELGQAHERYERKGNVVMAQRARVRLDEIRDTASR
jgi:hypothetical protein